MRITKKGELIPMIRDENTTVAVSLVVLVVFLGFVLMINLLR